MEELSIYDGAELVLLLVSATAAIGFAALKLGEWFARYTDEGGGGE